jgi:hypothetical protein
LENIDEIYQEANETCGQHRGLGEEVEEGEKVKKAEG